MTGAKAIAAARAELEAGSIVADYTLSPDEAWADLRTRVSIGEDPNAWASIRLAETSGLKLRFKAHEYDNGDIYGVWEVTVPADVERRLQALVWDYSDGEIAYTLTRSTRHPDWQLTSWTKDGLAWGHVDIMDDLSEAFDSSSMGSGVSVTSLRQAIFQDGTVLVRKGSSRIATNPSSRNGTLKQRLMR